MKKERTKKMTIQGMPFEHVVNIDPICTHSGISYSHLMRLLTEEFLERVRHSQEILDQGKNLDLNRDLAKCAALCVHTWDDEPMKQYIKNKEEK